MSWFQKVSKSDIERIRTNIERLESLRSRVHQLGYFAVASHSGGYNALKDLLEESVVHGRPKVRAKLESALTGENNQKIALDSPSRFQALMFEAEQLIKQEINTENKALREFVNE